MVERTYETKKEPHTEKKELYAEMHALLRKAELTVILQTMADTVIAVFLCLSACFFSAKVTNGYLPMTVLVTVVVISLQVPQFYPKVKYWMDLRGLSRKPNHETAKEALESARAFCAENTAASFRWILFVSEILEGKPDRVTVHMEDDTITKTVFEWDGKGGEPPVTVCQDAEIPVPGTTETHAWSMLWDVLYDVPADWHTMKEWRETHGGNA